MWRNIFIESCILSMLVFGGFYINANFLKTKINESEKKVRKQADENKTWVHISGKGYGIPPEKQKRAHISGAKVPILPSSSNKKTIGIGTP